MPDTPPRRRPPPEAALVRALAQHRQDCTALAAQLQEGVVRLDQLSRAFPLWHAFLRRRIWQVLAAMLGLLMAGALAIVWHQDRQVMGLEHKVQVLEHQIRQR